MKHLNGIELTTAFTELRANPAQLKQVVSDFFTSIQDLHNHINVHGEEKHFSHGDIKPANTVMVKEGGMLQWNIIDNDNLVNETDVLPGQTAATSSQETLDNGKGVLIDDYYSCLKTLGAVMRGAEHNNPKFQIKDADVNYITQMATRFFNLAPGDTKTFHDFIQKKGGTIADDNELRNAALLIIEKTFI